MAGELAFAIGTGSGGDDDVYAAGTQLSANAASDVRPGTWTPYVDSRRPAGSSTRKGAAERPGWACRAADGSGEEITLLNSPEFYIASSWHPDRRAPGRHERPAIDRRRDSRHECRRQVDAALRKSVGRGIVGRVLTRWTLHCLHLDRDRHRRGHRRDLPARRREVADLVGGWSESGVGPARQHAVLRRGLSR